MCRTIDERGINMMSAKSRTRHMLLCLVLPLFLTSCGHRIAGPPVVASPAKCSLQWDWADNPAVTEYRVTVWSDQPGPTPLKHTQSVPGTNTAIPCSAVGIDHDGTWWATVQACTKKKICSEPSAPFTFVVSAK